MPTFQHSIVDETSQRPARDARRPRWARMQEQDVRRVPIEHGAIPREEAIQASELSEARPSWDEVVEDYGDRVYRLAYRLTGNQHDAEDLTHDVFLRVFRYLDTYRPGTFEGWLHRITTNLFLDRMRRKQRLRFDALSDESAARLPNRQAGPEQAYEQSHFDDDVQRALDSLAPDFRAAVVLCDIEGLSYEEIADVLGIKLGTVRSRIHRGRAQLRDHLAHRAPSNARSRATRLPRLSPAL